jgi:hypothetical protein
LCGFKHGWLLPVRYRTISPHSSSANAPARAVIRDGATDAARERPGEDIFRRSEGFYRLAR